MAKTQTTIRLEEEDYKNAREVLEFLGLSYSQAVNMFNRMIVLNQGLPFEARIPNNETVEAMREAKHLEGDFVSMDNLKR